ncbi:hypothetical protein T459_05966 [Capsicum annuum]|uniref:Ubiquitin-like protease family profile domain-containing protein n=1 Tax=Capsicum annuum TaxID=4072 RepID=A0A2G3A9K4_CAPAN|nr:hypothetical protein T459_05966 [Capsicum annuum]
MDEHTAKTPTNSGIRNMNLVFDAPSFSLGLTQEDLVNKVVSNPLQLNKSEKLKEIRLKFCNDSVKITEILKKRLKKTPSPKEQKTKKWYEKKRKFKEIENDVDKSYSDESEEESEEEVVFNNIEQTKLKLVNLKITQKDVPEDERSVDSDDDFQDLPQKKINEHSKKKQKVGSSTPVVKKSSRKKQLNIVDEHTQTRTPAPHAAKAAGMKTPIFKPIPTLLAVSSKTKKEKKTARIFFLRQRKKQIDICFYYLRKKSKYDPNRSYKFSTVDCNFMNIIRSVHDTYSVDDVSITAGGQATHLNEYINRFCMHAAVPWHMVEDIYIAVNIKEKHHWVLAVLSFSERCIFLYDSYESFGHCPIVLAEIEKLATIIPLCLQQCDFYVKKEIQIENHPRYKDKDSSDMFDVLFQENLPQQPSGSLDCGVYMVTYAECLSYGHKVLANEFDPNALHIRYVALLWDYGTRKQDTNAHSDVETPVRPERQSRMTSVTKVFDV